MHARDRTAVCAVDNDFTDRNTTFMTYNLMHTARLLRAHDGFPVYGNQRRAWDAGQRFGFAPVDGHQMYAGVAPVVRRPRRAAVR